MKDTNVKIVLLLLTFLFVPHWFCGAFAETGGKDRTYRLLLIDSQQGEPYKTFRENLFEQLAHLGYQEGRNLEISYYTLANIAGRVPMIWDFNEKSKKNDAICLSGTLAGVAFKDTAEDSPDTEFIFGCITDPVGAGLINNFDTFPTGNFTGVAYPVPVATRLRFIRRVMPEVKTIGLICSTMPQAQSYKRWLEEALAQEEFKDLTVECRSVPYIVSEGGIDRMTMMAKKYVEELDPVVDLFLAPHDQMGISEHFHNMVYETATKPMVGLSLASVMEGWGATMTITPLLEDQARLVAEMIQQVFAGKSVKTIMPKWPESHEIAFDLQKVKKFGISIPDDLVEKAGINIVR